VTYKSIPMIFPQDATRWALVGAILTALIDINSYRKFRAYQGSSRRNGPPR
jgi:hypothetical protein